jgi:arylsulfatase A-like enzyme
MAQPNLIFVFADQLRYQATGFGGDPNVRTPCLDALANQSLCFTSAISGCPVCCPARASLLTGQYPHEHGVFMNDVCLGGDAVSLAEAFASAGYDTAYIGKWHLDGHGRKNYIPPERRHGFQHWEVLECTHDYNYSYYYAGDDPTLRVWVGYDAAAQTRSAQRYIGEHAGENPFALVLSWGPPHNPYETAPEPCRSMYDPAQLFLRPNVSAEVEAQARCDLAGYYAHISALDALVGDLLLTLDQTGIRENTVFVFWSDHGDMLGSQGQWRKQRPWEESIHVPLLIHAPGLFGPAGRQIDALINTPDLMPTLLDLCGVPVPTTVSGNSYAACLRGEEDPPEEAVLLASLQPFGEYTRVQHGGREYRGVRTAQYTYVRDLSGAWLLYDNLNDPYQQHNLVNVESHAGVQASLDAQLNRLLALYGDEFLPGAIYVDQWSYPLDDTGTVPFTDVPS